LHIGYDKTLTDLIQVLELLFYPCGFGVKNAAREALDPGLLGRRAPARQFQEGGLGHGPLKNAEPGLGGPGIGGLGGGETTRGRVFSGFLSLLKVLTPRRLDLLKKLYHQGPLSIRALSKYLERDYKNVHQDIQALEQAGLVSRNSAQTLSVPWGRILAEISLAA
jgi:hypothetical protein